MSDTPKFTVVDRRKFRADDDSSTSADTKSTSPSSEAAEPVVKAGSAPSAPPRLTLVEPIQSAAAKQEPPVPTVAVAEEDDFGEEVQLPPAPSTEESRFQKLAYDQAAERLENLVRAQNPGAPAAEKIGFEHLVQQLYLSAMMQMGAGTPEGQRPRVDILGARQTIDLLGVVLDKTRGNLTPQESRTIDTVLYELRMTFLELTRMISAQPQPPMPPPPGAKR
jgi:Domain of unknown function (DUF1844)